MRSRAILFIAWGEKYVRDVQCCLDEGRLPQYPIVLITDRETDTAALASHVRVIRRDFALHGKDRKAEALAALPAEFETVLFLDADTRVLDDISLGFDQAELHGIAMAPAPHYSLGDFASFGQVMLREGVPPRGQMIYNSGVIFLAANREDVRAVFALMAALARKDENDARWSDQPYLTLAMEMLGFNPYTLSPSFNHRAFGELISGTIRIWHSMDPVPAGAAELDRGHLRRYVDGKLVRALRVPD
jgi:hypothetical protein